MPELKDALRQLAEQRAAEAGGDFQAVVSRAKGRRRVRTGLVMAVAVGVVAVGVPWRHTEPPPAAKPVNPIVVTPETARPGQTVALTFPERSPRGVAFQLAKESAPDAVLYYLTSDWGRPAEHRPSWQPIDGNWGWVDVGISGPGPDRVIVPDTIEDGRYRLCTANARRQVCGLVIVAG